VNIEFLTASDFAFDVDSDQSRPREVSGMVTDELADGRQVLVREGLQATTEFLHAAGLLENLVDHDGWQQERIDRPLLIGWRQRGEYAWL
jgi:hypothetical protein